MTYVFMFIPESLGIMYRFVSIKSASRYLASSSLPIQYISYGPAKFLNGLSNSTSGKLFLVLRIGHLFFLFQPRHFLTQLVDTG
jgi:hypothetical protein